MRVTWTLVGEAAELAKRDPLVRALVDKLNELPPCQAISFAGRRPGPAHSQGESAVRDACEALYAGWNQRGGSTSC